MFLVTQLHLPVQAVPPYAMHGTVPQAETWHAIACKHAHSLHISTQCDDVHVSFLQDSADCSVGAT